MRFATVEEPGGAVRCGVVVDGVLHRLPLGTTVLDLLREDRLFAAGRGALSARDSVPLEEVRLLPPLEAPTVRDFVAFEEHVEGVRRGVEGRAGVVPEWYEAPAFYFTNPHSLIGAHDEVAVPPGCAVLDYELEVAAVIGRVGADLTPERARSHIAGYTIFNDWSARDLQRREMRVGLGPAKGKDFAGTLGPVLVTADELEPHRDADGFLRLAMTVSVNGVELGRDLLSNMGWPFEELVAHAARGSRVRPGDVLGSGTCGNGGCLAELWGTGGAGQPPPLRPGDVVEMTVEGIGGIANTVVDGPTEAEVAPVRPARGRDRQRP
ncbi:MULTISPECIES: fumarylacetoacetate hydrolase family protein [unclassified Actinopolyspora]|uniref:fumarylacetoacetate hydrolase family protein n=1 Tax=Actinopolyspora TaxID=1849 RepID=UPI0013F674BD|nr:MULTISPECIES: fumarylacetoacetate hydrolase family protein [unclassified Actinopolyspora]NHD16121.1 fumarylacetoacetate hydrolase family protein [Actinopolyspora sp. BKK2]NHE74665.1 fumarylacetoacetate hydrolase family protein [Actinopolyspora sp. BKK1]